MTDFLLTRSGMAPLKFSGEQIASDEGRIALGREHNRWHDLAVYRTGGGAYVVAIEYHTQWQGECEYSSADVCDAAAGVADLLIGYDPAQHCQGYPPGTAYEERQARLVQELRGRYAAQVSAVLAAPEFAEEVDHV